jgi:heme A synthase
VALHYKLAAVLLAFLAILAIVIFMAFRERRLGKAIARDDRAAQEAQDARVLVVIFTAILGGVFLTLVVAWLVFI